MRLSDSSDQVFWVSVGVVLCLGVFIFIFFHYARRTGRRPPKRAVVDGSNVMYWKNNTPEIETIREVLKYLMTRGFTPGLIFDANAGYLLTGRYEHDEAFEKLFGLPRDHVMVVHRGVSADISILTAARDLGARIVSNDRYREWTESYPEICKPGHLIQGGYRDGNLWMDLGGED